MAKGRMVSKSISTSLRVNRLPGEGSLLFTWLIPHTDDYGRMQADPFYVKAAVVPMKKSLEIENISEILCEMDRVGLIVWYEVKGERYLQIIDNDQHQKFDRGRVESRFPAPPKSAVKKAMKCSSDSNQVLKKEQSIAPNAVVNQIKLSQVKLNQSIPPTPLPPGGDGPTDDHVTSDDQDPKERRLLPVPDTAPVTPEDKRQILGLCRSLGKEPPLNPTGCCLLDNGTKASDSLFDNPATMATVREVPRNQRTFRNLCGVKLSQIFISGPPGKLDAWFGAITAAWCNVQRRNGGCSPERTTRCQQLIWLGLCKLHEAIGQGEVKKPLPYFRSILAGMREQAGVK